MTLFPCISHTRHMTGDVDGFLLSHMLYGKGSYLQSSGISMGMYGFLKSVVWRWLFFLEHELKQNAINWLARTRC